MPVGGILHGNGQTYFSENDVKSRGIVAQGGPRTKSPDLERSMVIRMEKPIRVLHVLGGLSLGGAESRIMDLYRCMDRDKVQFDFLVHQDDGKRARIPEFYDEEAGKLGGKVYILPKFKGYNYFAYKRAIRDFFREHHEFAVVQGHMTSTAAIYLPEAARAGIPVRAAHARSAGVDKGAKGILTRLLRLPLLKRADYCFACSREAGESAFGKKWKDSPKAFVIPNAVEAQKFMYREGVRKEVREELGIMDCYVLGHVGRFHYAKNHEFLLEVFAVFRDKLLAEGELGRAVLILLGEGVGMEEIKEQARRMNIARDVLFLGNRKDVWRYYQAMDFFVFPSRFEGLPGTVVEAQAAGLRCLISDRITPEVGFSELVHYEDIESAPGKWAEYIINHMFYERKDMCKAVEAAGFDVREQATRLEKFYLSGKME